MNEVTPPSHIAAFQEALVSWFATEGRSYPWRETEDPYAILVSELMLQQTRIETVRERRYFERWMERFPDVHALARAGEEEVLSVWQGLGYYNRARNLQAAARIISRDREGVFPDTYEGILKLPGVGPYTAGAVASFAFGRRAPIVDGNVIRVISRLFRFGEPVDTASGRRQIDRWAETLTPSTRVREYNSGIMELGQRICGRGEPDCPVCPVAAFCASAGDPASSRLPLKAKSVAVTRKEEHVLLWRRGAEVFLVPETGSRRRGLWRLPEWAGNPEGRAPLLELSYAITRYRVDLKVFPTLRGEELDPAIRDRGGWFSARTGWPPLGAPYRRVVDSLEQGPEPGA